MHCCVTTVTMQPMWSTRYLVRSEWSRLCWQWLYTRHQSVRRQWGRCRWNST